MQVRVFEAEDMATGLKLIKKELGPDALILSTRTIRSGKLGLIGKPILEITAAIDNGSLANDTNARIKESSAANNYSQQTGSTPQNGGFSHVVGDNIDNFLTQEESALPKKQHTTQPAPSQNLRQTQSYEDTSQLKSEVNELKDLVKNLAGQISSLANEKSSAPSEIPKSLSVSESSYTDKAHTPSIHGDYLLSMLINRGINVDTSRTIAGFLRDSLTDNELANEDHLIQTCIETIQNLLEVSPPDFSKGSQHRIAFVGPTGVGKTTTLAKIAASYLAKHSNSIALITIDTYRIAAVEQLKVYGEIMHLPVDVVITPEQLESALIKHSDKKLILIDTAGRSPRDAFCIDELSSFLRPELNIDKHLVLSATTRENELMEGIERFSQLGINNTIFTKIDECSNLGVILNVQIQNPNPLSYVTNGQRVPEDLLEISPNSIAKLIMSKEEGRMHD